MRRWFFGRWRRVQSRIGWALGRCLLLACLGALSPGCDSDTDPDSLVRELRVLGMRFGESERFSVAELQAQLGIGADGMPTVTFAQPTLSIRTFAVAPHGPGRRRSEPPVLQYDWFSCIGPQSLFSAGTLDAECRKLSPSDPPARANPSLLSLDSARQMPGETGPTEQPVVVLDTGKLTPIVGRFLAPLLSRGTGGGGGGGGLMLPTEPIVLLLPVVVEVTVKGAGAGLGVPGLLDREVAYSFLRLTLTLPGMTAPPPNRNPALLPTESLFSGTVEGEGTPRSAVAPCLDATQPAQCPTLEVSRAQPTYFVGRAEAGSAETYSQLDAQTQMQKSRTEILRYIWFSTDGTFSEERTGDELPETRWEHGEKYALPAGSQQTDLWLVVQDNRGGTDMQRFALLPK